MVYSWQSDNLTQQSPIHMLILIHSQLDMVTSSQRITAVVINVQITLATRKQPDKYPESLKVISVCIWQTTDSQQAIPGNITVTVWQIFVIYLIYVKSGIKNASKQQQSVKSSFSHIYMINKQTNGTRTRCRYGRSKSTTNILLS